ncbi:MAG: SPFH/Band 7/PHB domain protein [Anaerolineae bacterium]|jgi:regulator of protease activity HflC (stomatin/prohibitin superfamily)|nr:SPFH/Band 7/PHB domain protein [Anaerolineae bacterium]
MNGLTTLIVVSLIVVVALFIVGGLLRTFVLVAREYERFVVFRLGRSIGAKGPGLIILIPFIDTATKVDLREQFMEVPQQTAITKDNAPISVDFLTYWKVSDPERSVLQVGNFAAASQGIATTTLRAVIGDITLDDVLAQRERINQTLRSKLDEVTERWGVKITAVEIREITPPRDVQEAMNRQMSAERTRRALVTEADGKRQAAITLAEGEKMSAILRAEGLKQSAILEAEGQKMAQALRAEGFASALEEIFKSAKNVDANTMLIQYLEALKSIGASPATKYIFPMEFTGLVKPLAEMMTAGGNGKREDAKSPGA